MLNFAAIDFETANQHATSVCSVGIVVVREGEITEKFYSLIKPEPEFILTGMYKLMELLWKIRSFHLYFRMSGSRSNQ